MAFLRSVLLIAAFASQAYAADIFNRQSMCGGTGTVNMGSSLIIFTPNFPSLYSPAASCSWSYTSGPGGYLSVYCAGSVPCTDSFTIASATGTNRTFCGTNSISVSAGPAVNITLKPSSTSAGGVSICVVVAQPLPTTSLSPTTPVRTTMLPQTTPLQTTALPLTTAPTPTTPSKTTPPAPTTPPKTTPPPVTTPPAPVTPPKTTPPPLVTTLKTTPPPPTTPPRTTPVATPSVSTPVTTKPSSNCTCGIAGPGPNRIVGGSPAGQNQFPWMVQVWVVDFFCGGSVIAPGWVLTAAHCFTSSSPAGVDVIAGRYSISTDSPTEQWNAVTQIFIHPGWNTSTYDNDIALIKLSTPFTFNSAVSPICLPTKFATFDFANQTGIASGWGTTFSGGDQLSDTLLQVTLPILSTSQCRNYPIIASSITNNMICTYTPGKDACQGDSGGPLGWIDPVSKRTILAGITSWGKGCAFNNIPGVFTKVNNYLTWIQQTTGQAITIA